MIIFTSNGTSALAHGISGYDGSVKSDKISDIVIWSPQFFWHKTKNQLAKKLFGVKT